MYTRTHINNIILSTSHFNNSYDKSIFVLLSYTNNSVDIIGSPHTQDLAYYAKHFSVFDTKIDPDLFMLLKVVPQDPRDLPFALAIMDDAFVIYDDWYMSDTLSSMEEVTKEIEDLFETFTEAKIEDFAVLIGRIMGDNIKKAILRQIEYHDKREI